MTKVVFLKSQAKSLYQNHHVKIQSTSTRLKNLHQQTTFLDGLNYYSLTMICINNLEMECQVNLGNKRYFL